MKKITSLLFVLLFSATAFSQKLPGIDKSPMDMAYYPNDFAHDRKFAPDKIGDIPAIARVIYSRPAKKGREIFGGMIKWLKIPTGLGKSCRPILGPQGPNLHFSKTDPGPSGANWCQF
ncbi:MAG: DUF2911 domain-containing protein [Spirosomaceae bacterium]|nr:DUF2911 domain-containing protein [Spirosomataceae bacterium]